MAENMLTNRHDVEQAINDSMFQEAREVGALAGSRFGAMTASTYGQAAMQGRALGGLLGGQDPRMRRQDLIDEFMHAFPEPPQTKKDYLDMSKKASELELYGIQGQLLEIAATIPKKKIATTGQIDAFMGSMRLMQGTNFMLDDYLETQVDPAVWKKMTDPEKQSYRTDVKAQFNDILKEYGAYLGTLDLSPQDIDQMMFTKEGRILNMARFKQYLEAPMNAGNMFAKHLYDNNHLILEALGGGNGGGNGDTETIMKGDGTDIVGDGTYLATLYNEGLGDKLVTDGDNRNDYDNLSKVDKNEFNAARHLDVMTDLNNIYANFSGKGYKEGRTAIESTGGGLMAEEQMTGTELNIENQDDAIQAWIHPWWEPTGVSTALGDAMKYFMSKPPAEFEKFKKNPKKYFIENILRGQYYTMGKDEQWNTADDVLIDSETDIPLMWGIQ